MSQGWSHVVGEIIGSFTWPSVGLILGLVAFILFREEWRTLLRRTRKISPSGWEGPDSPAPQAPAPKNPAAEEFFRAFENRLLAQQEQRIIDDLSRKGLTDQPDRERALVKLLAANQLALQFEWVYGVIWASQVWLLLHLNSRVDGDALGSARAYYDGGRSQFPKMYEDYSFDQWLGFLESSLLLGREAERVRITEVGREFLKYLLDMRKPGPAIG